MFGKKKKKLEAERREEELRLQQQQELQKQQADQEAAKKQEDKIFLESELIDDDEDDNALPKEYEAIAYILKQEQGDDLVAQPVDDESAQSEQASESVEKVKDEAPAVEAPVEETAEETPALEEVKEELSQEQVEEQAQEETVDEQSEEAEEPAEEEVEQEEPQEKAVADETASEEQKEEVVYVVDGPSEDDDEIVKPAKLVKLPNLVDYMLAQNMSKQMKMNIATLLLSTYNKYKDVPAEKKIVIQCMAKVMKSLIQG